MKFKYVAYALCAIGYLAFCFLAWKDAGDNRGTDLLGVTLFGYVGFLVWEAED